MMSKLLLYGGLGLTAIWSCGYIIGRTTSSECENPELQADFELAKYAGVWYEFERSPNSFEKGDCITAQYIPKDDNGVTVVNT